jgi:hypothetical protein
MVLKSYHLGDFYERYGWVENAVHIITVYILSRALDRGRIGVFYAFKMPKMHWR